MPIEFLTDEQAGKYGQFAGTPSRARLERFFFLNDADRALIEQRRRDHNRLGFGVQLGIVRFLGMFLADPLDVPEEVIGYVADQLKIDDLSTVNAYGEREKTTYEHAWEIRRAYGYREFVEADADLRDFLVARAWTTTDGPQALFDRATSWLIEHKVLLPGVKRRGSTRGPNKRDSEGPQTEPAFPIALFAGVDRPAVEQKAVSLDELRQMLSKFEVLADKRRTRCWSPTRYADGANTRANDGVAEVSCLVFDCDRVPPDPERLANVYWLSHTTYKHTTTAPRWRVVIPLTTPVPAASWHDVWQRARAALCPEADPSCKDASRQYNLPSHSGGVTARTTCHDGPLLDPSTLPALPFEQSHAGELRRSPSTRVVRRTNDSDRRRGEAYMDSVITTLESVGPGGRNDALNHAAWTLGRWIAVGALEQAEVEDELSAAAEANGLVGDDGERQCWATIRSGLGAGLQQPIDLDASAR
ncbi:MAG: DUF4158 domain-containing protein [Chloroflexota bacterium]|nr:DUF4158 domain-containing protein [Chloroflexota bacterium]